MIPRLSSLFVLVFLVSCSSTAPVRKSSASTPGSESSGEGARSDQSPVYRPRLVTSQSEGGLSQPEQHRGVGNGESGGDMEVSGLGGTIDEAAVGRAFDRKKYEIEQCILGKARAMTYLEGTLNFRFTVFPDGRIDFKVIEDDLGNFAVESCLVQVVRSIRLGRPRGGKVKISYPLRIPNRGTPHITWGASRLQRVLRPFRRKLRSCKQGSNRRVTLHLYILPGGRLISLGASSSKGVESEVARCAFDVLGGVQFPDPLGKVVKAQYSF